MDNQTKNKIPIGISSCLLGNRVRFDSGHKNNDYIKTTLGQYFEFTPFCPEVDIGLGVPREPIRLIRLDKKDSIDKLRCVGTKTPELDVTEKLVDSAKKQSDWVASMRGYIFKKDSPSCGMARVKIYTNNHPSKEGIGIFAREIMSQNPLMPIEEEGRLGDARLRENFIKRVFMYNRWCDLEKAGITWNALYEFHGQHKLIFMSHNQDHARKIGRELTQADKANLEEFKLYYATEIMDITRKPASRKNHVNVLQHLQGYLKKHIDADSKQELLDSITQYSAGLVPLIVPITLLKHHFRKHPHEYVENSYYLHTHPKELMLLNTI